MLKEKFIERANQVHKGKYDYSLLPENFKVSEKVQIRCREHGVFLQAAYSHTNGAGCPACKGVKQAEMNSVSVAEWQERVKEKFGGRVSVELPDDVKSTDTVEVSCSIHGKYQSTLKNLWKSTYGCPKCAEQADSTTRMSMEQFVQKAVEVHGASYDYGQVDFSGYKNNQHKIVITCPKHGEFTKTVKRHLSGEGCPICNKKLHYSTLKAAHEDTLRHRFGIKFPDMDFSESEFKERLDVKAVCKKHGEVKTTLYRLMGPFGCPECAKEALRIPRDTWIERFTSTHKGTYDYRLIPYEMSSSTLVPIVCHKHRLPEVFRQRPYDHMSGHGCPKCKLIAMAGKPSQLETEVLAFLTSLNTGEIQTQVPVNYDKQQYILDIVHTDLGFAVEFNGLYFHSQKFQANPNYHLNKTKAAEAQGLRLIHIFEDDWLNRKEVVKHFLTYQSGRLKKVMARKTKLIEVKHQEARTFYNQYHLQGASIASQQVHYGLDLNGELIAVMSFTQHSSGRRVLKQGCWELVRFASKYAVAGGASKLFKHFLRTYNPEQVLSFSWTHLFQGSIYENLGFKLEKVLSPDYMYVGINRCRRLHKAGFQRSKLQSKLKTFNPNLSERENCEANKIYRIYDCGKKRWVWHR